MSGPFIEDQVSVLQLDHGAEILEGGLESRGSVGHKTSVASASNRTNQAGRMVHPANTLVKAVSDDEIAVAGPERDVRASEPGREGGAAAPAEPALTGSGQGGNSTGVEIDLSYQVRVGVG